MALPELRTWNHLAAGGWGWGWGAGAEPPGQAGSAPPLSPSRVPAPASGARPGRTLPSFLLPPPQRPCRTVRPSPSSAWILQVFALCGKWAPTPSPKPFPAIAHHTSVSVYRLRRWGYSSLPPSPTTCLRGLLTFSVSSARDAPPAGISMSLTSFRLLSLPLTDLPASLSPQHTQAPFPPHASACFIALCTPCLSCLVPPSSHPPVSAV